MCSEISIKFYSRKCKGGFIGFTLSLLSHPTQNLLLCLLSGGGVSDDSCCCAFPGGMEPSPSILGIPPKFMTEWSVFHSF